jgi:N-acetylmuramoyl-L-alanine amidase
LLIVIGALLLAGCSREGPSSEVPSPPPVSRNLHGLPYRLVTDLLAAKAHQVEPHEQGIWESFTPNAHWRWQAGSRRMWFNGILVWLDFPSLVADDVLYIAEHDIAFTLLPMSESRAEQELQESTAKPRPRIMIDPGHGGRDAGAVNERFMLKEKELALKTALQLAETLRLLGWEVLLTREDDTFVPLPNRAQMSIAAEADLFVSIHYNAAVNPLAEGIEVFILTPPTAEEQQADNLLAGHQHLAESLLLGWHLQEALIRQTQATDRGVRRNRFAVLRDLQQPGVLVELGFLSHETTARRLKDPEAVADLVEALSIGLEAFQKRLNRN